MKKRKSLIGDDAPWWHRPLMRIGVSTLVALVMWVVFYGIFRGTAAALATFVASSVVMKLSITLTVVTAVAVTFNQARPNASRSYDGIARGSVTITVIGTSAIVLLAVVFGNAGGYMSGQALAESIDTGDTELPTYEWRTPWDVASAAVGQRAEVDKGNFAEGDTTFLPALNSYSTPVTGRGFMTGFTKMVIQREGSTRTQVCDFDGEAPRPGGFMANNLRRKIALMDATLVVNHGDIWGFCENGEARLVVPVTRMTAGLGQGHPLPAGVVVFDGPDGVHHANVERGEYPGPVYPMSLAAAQRDALKSTGSLMDKVFNRAGFKLSESSYDTGREDSSAPLNNSEFLLVEADGEGYDFVTPLTPMSNSERITAVSTISADHVRTGELNTLTVHRLGDKSQRGNGDQVEAIRANFPSLGWETGIAVAEIIPTGPGTFEASLRNGGVVAKRIRITGEGMCLLTASGKQTDCTTTDSSDSPNRTDGGDTDGADADTADTPVSVPGDTEMAELSDEELLDLIDASATELRKRQED